MNILAIAAHPDDVEFMCGGTLLKYAAQGHKIFIALTTSGNTGSNVILDKAQLAARREAEQLEAAQGYSAQVRFLRYEDEGLQDTPDARRAVLTAIRWADPDVILTNAPWDGSTDHAMTGKLVAAALLIVGGKLHPADLPPIQKRPHLFFWDTAAGIGRDPGAYVDVTEHAAKKFELLSRHKSQFDWMDTFDTSLVESCRTLARMRGLQAGCTYAEGFTGQRLTDCMADYRLLP